jgi:chromosome segregation ATPase
VGHIITIDSQIIHLEEENKTLKERIENLERDNVELKYDNLELKRDNVELKRDNVELKRDNIKLNKEIVHLKDENLQLRKEIVILKRDNMELKEENTIIRENLSIILNAMTLRNRACEIEHQIMRFIFPNCDDDVFDFCYISQLLDFLENPEKSNRKNALKRWNNMDTDSKTDILARYMYIINDDKFEYLQNAIRVVKREENTLAHNSFTNDYDLLQYFKTTNNEKLYDRFSKCLHFINIIENYSSNTTHI